ncbi:MAG: single-stranded-DNA-specific exonuclease RecJ [Gammaproteobacteria bacterium]|nr:single-stranded-DNA-specific exonuclease RecJ [Gammaproteobacteria bacterium]
MSASRTESQAAGGALPRPRIVKRAVAGNAFLPAELHAVTRRVLAARGITSPALLDTSLKGLLPAAELGGTAAAVRLIAEVMGRGARILVVGDFDADGATSTALALRALRAMGATDVGYLVPNRFEFGYGLTPEIVDLAAQRQPSLIITVDNGISSIEGVARAREHGIKVLITDHHLAGATRPAADAIVNPNLPDEAFPSKALAGVGVIFYVMTALRTYLREQGWFSARGMAEPNLATLLDLVALGTVADVVPLDQNNRRLVAQGLARIRAGQCQPGISALIAVGGRNRARLTPSDLGFAVGPRLNAAGRLSDMSLGIECLLSDDAETCAAIAEQLDALNRERRELEDVMRESAFDSIEAELKRQVGRELPAAFCVFDEDWHQGVIGIVAARVKDRFHRPAIAFAPADEDTLKGSARSIPGVHIRDALDAVAARHPELLSKFGGHAMAAGLSLSRAALPAFQAAFAAQVDSVLDAETRERRIDTDGELAAGEFNLNLAKELAAVAPWGQGFPEPRFEGVFRIEDRRVVGGKHARLVLSPQAGRGTVAAIAFGAAGEPWFAKAEHIHAVYKLDINDYGGIETVQLVVDYACAV